MVLIFLNQNTFVVDCDRHGNVDGVDAWEVLCLFYGYDMSAHYVVNTPRGGQHIYFRQDPRKRLGNRTGDLPQGIDIRGDGGYVIAGGSVLPDGRTYEMANWGTLPVVPAWLQTLISKQWPSPASDSAPQTRHETPTDRERRYAAVALKEETKKVTTSTEGSRNTEPLKGDVARRCGEGKIADVWLGAALFLIFGNDLLDLVRRLGILFPAQRVAQSLCALI